MSVLQSGDWRKGYRRSKKYFSWSMRSDLFKCMSAHPHPAPAQLGWPCDWYVRDSPSYISCPRVIISSLPFHSQTCPGWMINYMTTLSVIKKKKKSPVCKEIFVGKGCVPKMFYPFFKIMISMCFSFSWQTLWAIFVIGSSILSHSSMLIKTREEFLRPKLMILS